MIIMTETQELMKKLTEAVMRTKEYNQYHNLLEQVKNDPGLYSRIGDYHRRSLELQMSDCENFIYENNKLQKEYYDLQNNSLSKEFFAAEHQYCVFVRELQHQFLDEINIETDFLEN